MAQATNSCISQLTVQQAAGALGTLLAGRPHPQSRVRVVRWKPERHHDRSGEPLWRVRRGAEMLRFPAGSWKGRVRLYCTHATAARIAATLNNATTAPAAVLDPGPPLFQA